MVKDAKWECNVDSLMVLLLVVTSIILIINGRVECVQ